MLQDTKMEALAEQLNNYSKHGIPQLPNADEDLEEGRDNNMPIYYRVTVFQ